MLECESRAPQPALVEESDDDPEAPTDAPATEGNQVDQEASPMSDEQDPYVGYVRAEGDMEGHYIFYRPSQGQKGARRRQKEKRMLLP